MDQLRHELLNDALRFYQELLEQKETDPTVQFETAEAYGRVGSIQNALGQNALAQEAYQESIKLLKRLVDENPSEPDYQAALAGRYDSLGGLMHSMGQYVQEGERSVFETVISIGTQANRILVPDDTENLDNLNYLSGQRIDRVNKMAELGTLLAHVDGGVPNILVEVPALNEYHMGALIYFFEKACAISGYMLGINPFNQPGVEAYKKNMFALLEKPGFEEETRKVKDRLASRSDRPIG